jgi:hypothetical protein
MSKEAVEAIIGKAVLDSQFREALFATPEEVLAEYDLTEEEVVALRAIDFETMESFAGTLDERISKSVTAVFTRIDGLVGSPDIRLSETLSGDPLQVKSAPGINLAE